MGMTIDEHIGVIEDLKSTMSVCMPDPEKTEICTSLNEAIDTMRKYQQLQADYEKRLKADMVAMLTEIQLEIEEIEIDVPFGFEPVSKTAAFYDGVSASSRLIQQKINKLKEAD